MPKYVIRADQHRSVLIEWEVDSLTELKAQIDDKGDQADLYLCAQEDLSLVDYDLPTLTIIDEVKDA